MDCSVAVTVGRWWASLHWHALRCFLTPGGQCAQHCFSLQAIAWSDRVKDKTQFVLRDPPFFGLHYLWGFRTMPRWVPVLFLSLFVLSKSTFNFHLGDRNSHYVSGCTNSLTSTFWVVRIPFRRLDSYRRQRTWTTDNFQPRAKYMCDWVRETGWLWRLLDFGRFLPFVWRIFLFTLAALSPVCLSV